MKNAPFNFTSLHKDWDRHPLSWEPQEAWKRQPEVRFLQLHCIKHGRISLKPKFGPDKAGIAHFWGLDLGQEEVRDPLDPICWYLLYLVRRDGVLALKECKYKSCERFFQVETARREYCSDLCRSKDHVKSKEQNREYMREYRKRKEKERREIAKMKTLEKIKSAPSS
jgi:hypothetical protein